MDNIPNDEELVRVLAMEGMGLTVDKIDTAGRRWALRANGWWPVDFRPLTDANDTEMLIEAMKVKMFDWDLSGGFADTPWVVTITPVTGEPMQECTDDLKRAVCNAAYKALKGI